MADGDTGSPAGLAALILSEVRWRRDDQLARQESLNRRINTMFALNFAVLAILGASLRFGEISLPGFVDYLIFATIFVLVFDVAALIAAYVIGQGIRRPSLKDIRAIISMETSADRTRWVVNEILLALETNDEDITRKGRLTSLAVASSFLAILMVATVAALALQFAEPTSARP